MRFFDFAQLLVGPKSEGQLPCNITDLPSVDTNFKVVCDNLKYYKQILPPPTLSKIHAYIAFHSFINYWKCTNIFIHSKVVPFVQHMNETNEMIN
jgi:hypothetical protein